MIIANSFGYTTSDIKNTRVYGNRNTSVFTASVKQLMSAINIDKKKYHK